MDHITVQTIPTSHLNLSLLPIDRVDVSMYAVPAHIPWAQRLHQANKHPADVVRCIRCRRGSSRRSAWTPPRAVRCCCRSSLLPTCHMPESRPPQQCYMQSKLTDRHFSGLLLPLKGVCTSGPVKGILFCCSCRAWLVTTGQRTRSAGLSCRCGQRQKVCIILQDSDWK